MRRVSKRRFKTNAIYSKKRKVFLEAHQFCEIGVGEATNCLRGARSVDVHHKAGRLGGNLLDESTWLAACRRCHDWVHRNPAEARKRGWLK